jgi:hypothetical protein
VRSVLADALVQHRGVLAPLCDDLYDAATGVPHAALQQAGADISMSAFHVLALLVPELTFVVVGYSPHNKLARDADVEPAVHCDVCMPITQVYGSSNSSSSNNNSCNSSTQQDMVCVLCARDHFVLVSPGSDMNLIRFPGVSSCEAQYLFIPHGGADLIGECLCVCVVDCRGKCTCCNTTATCCGVPTCGVQVWYCSC